MSVYRYHLQFDGKVSPQDEMGEQMGIEAEATITSGFDAAIGALRSARDAGLITTANSQLNRLNAHLLRETLAALRPEGIAVWRLQLTVPMGRAAEHPEWILQPWQVISLIDTASSSSRSLMCSPTLPSISSSPSNLASTLSANSGSASR